MAKGFKHGSGGGAGLNFKVVGNPKPEVAKENTIWINTHVPISSYIFSIQQPTDHTEGMVWIDTGPYSTVAFNALKKNSIFVCPLSAKQYISGVWTHKDAQIYQNAAWNPMLQGIVFDADSLTNETGGFTVTASKATYGTTTASITTESDGTYRFNVKNGDNQWYNADAYSNTVFDLSHFNTARFTWTVKANGVAGVYMNMGFNNALVSVDGNLQKAGTYETYVDVSALSEDVLRFAWGYSYSNGAQAAVSWYLNKIELF